jgi:transcriptional regulator with XRE-family HTH domain
MPDNDETTAQFTIPCTLIHNSPTQVREVLPCPRCGLVQFRTRNSLCRRCHRPLETAERTSTPEAGGPASSADPADLNELTLVKNLGARLREVRRMYGLTQRALARRMNVPRTYISKVEMSRTIPTIATLYRFAGALGLEVQHLLCATRVHPCELEAISQDPFLKEIEPLAEKLNPQQRAVFLRVLRETALRPKSAA